MFMSPKYFKAFFRERWKKGKASLLNFLSQWINVERMVETESHHFMSIIQSFGLLKSSLDARIIEWMLVGSNTWRNWFERYYLTRLPHPTTLTARTDTMCLWCDSTRNIQHLCNSLAQNSWPKLITKKHSRHTNWRETLRKTCPGF